MASFSALNNSTMSADAQHLLRVASARRDYVNLGAAGFGINTVCLIKMATLSMGASPVLAAAALAGLSAYAGISALRNGRRVDRAVTQGAVQFAGHEVPAIPRRLFMPLENLSEAVRKTEQAAPDFISALAERRRRRWEDALDPNYRGSSTTNPGAASSAPKR